MLEKKRMPFRAQDETWMKIICSVTNHIGILECPNKQITEGLEENDFECQEKQEPEKLNIFGI